MEQLRRRMYTLAFFDEFGPLYALFTLWFADNGVSTSQLSIVFLLWATITIVLEIPSGALADRTDRRVLVAVAFALRAIGIGVWMVSPTFPGLVIGAVLWAVHSSLASGAWEALIHDQLEAVAAEHRYANVMARVGQFGNLGVAAGTLVAAPLVGAGFSIELLGWFTVATHAVTIAIVSTFPETRRPADEQHTTINWWTTLQSGVTETRRSPQLLPVIAIGALVEGLFIFDEYVPLLTRQRGGSDALAPLVFLAVWAGLLIGGEIAARLPTLERRPLSALMVLGITASAFAIRTDEVWTLTLIGIGYAGLEATRVLSDARLQERAPSATRATVTSVRSFNAGIVAAIAFGTVGLLTNGNDPTPGLTIALLMLIPTTALIWRSLPAATPKTDRPTRRPADQSSE